MAVEAVREGMRTRALIGLPTASRNDARLQFLFVNGRPVQDRLLRAAAARRLQRPAVPRPPAGGGLVAGAPP